MYRGNGRPKTRRKQKKNGDNMICLPVFCFDDVFVRYRIEGIMHAQAVENLSAEIADGKIYWKV